MRDRYSNVAEQEIEVPIPEGRLNEAIGIMAADLYRKALEAGFNLMENTPDASQAKGCAGTPMAIYRGIRDGVAVYTCIRRTGRGEK